MPTFASYNQIAIINRSSVVSDTDASTMVVALNTLLPIFCSDWSILPVTTVYIPRAATILPINLYYIYLMDTSDQEGALAYHDLSGDVPYGKVFAKTILSTGVLMYEETLTLQTVSQCLSHEVFELIIDPRCNTWWMNYKTRILVAAEVSDPVQGNVVVVTLANGVKVGMSDWILPSWQDAQTTIGPFNHLNTLSQAFQVLNGYAMIIKDSKVITVYGDIVNPKALSHSQESIRTATRTRKFNLAS